MIRGVAVYYSSDEKDKGSKWEERPIPEEEMERYEHWRHDLIEKVAETDDHLMGKYITDPSTIT